MSSYVLCNHSIAGAASSRIALPISSMMLCGVTLVEIVKSKPAVWPKNVASAASDSELPSPPVATSNDALKPKMSSVPSTPARFSATFLILSARSKPHPLIRARKSSRESISNDGSRIPKAVSSAESQASFAY